MTEDTHRVVHKYFQWGREVYEPGDTLTPPEAALRSHPDRFERIADDGESEDAGDEDETPGVEAGETTVDVPDVTDMTVSEIREWASAETDADAVSAALDAEQSRDNPRTTAIDILDGRVNALAEED